MKKIRRGVVMFSDSFDGDKPESVKNAAVFCDAMKKAALLMVPVQIENAKKKGEEIDESEAMKIAESFECRVMKINVS